VTFSEGSEIEAGTPFTKTWRFRNEGDVTWPAGVKVKYIGKGGSDQMGGPESIQIPGIVQPNETVDVSIQLTAPNEPGRYTGYWRLYDPTIERKFGPRFWVQITVPSGSSSPMINSSSDEDKKKKKDHKREYHHGRHHKRPREEKDQDDYVEVPIVVSGQDATVTDMMITTDDSDKKKRKKEKREKEHHSKKNESSSSSSEEEGKGKEKPKKAKMSELLGQLSSMGFNDKGTNIKLLKKFDRDMGKVVHALVENISRESSVVNNATSNQKN